MSYMVCSRQEVSEEVAEAGSAASEGHGRRHTDRAVFEVGPGESDAVAGLSVLAAEVLRKAVPGLRGEVALLKRPRHGSR